MKRDHIVFFISLLLILLFVHTGISKIVNYQEFRLQVGQSPFITKYANFISWVLPTMEVIVGILLAFNKTKLLGFYCSLSFMTMFSMYIFLMLHYAPKLPCSCGGIIASLSWKQHLWINILFTLLCVLGVLLYDSGKKQYSK
jgi:uncharacterized membrane protein YphA (DoxX/SURF4 family)